MLGKHRTRNNSIIDAIGYLAFWVLVSTGIMMKYILLPGRSRGANDPTSLMGLGRHEWGDVHFWASIVFVSAIVIHLVLHWSWIEGVFQKFLHASSKKVLLPALGLPILIAFSPMFGVYGFGEAEEHGSETRTNAYYEQRTGHAADRNIAQIDYTAAEQSGEQHEGHDINGFMIRGRTTLAEIEQGTGVQVEAIALAMNLPSDLPKNERVSSLKEKYGFEMDKIREVVKQLAVK